MPAQRPTLPIEQPIYLNDSVNESHYEFSGVAVWKDKILLIPQHVRATDDYHIIAIDTASIDSVIRHQTLFATATSKITFSINLAAVHDAIKTAILPRRDFGGFEAGVVVGDELFLTIETDSLCYVVKGSIDGKTMEVNFNPGDTMSLPKPDYLFSNAGYESIAWLPQQQKLIALYENNAIGSAATGYTFTTSLQQKEAISFQSPLLFRLTDIAHAGGNTLLGINHYYLQYSPLENCDSLLSAGNRMRTEYCYYIRNQVANAVKEMGANPQQTSFTRIVQLTLTGNRMEWKPKAIISYSNDNWEGILPYKKGVLMVVDGRPPGVPCKLSYFELP